MNLQYAKQNLCTCKMLVSVLWFETCTSTMTARTEAQKKVYNFSQFLYRGSPQLTPYHGRLHCTAQCLGFCGERERGKKIALLSVHRAGGAGRIQCLRRMYFCGDLALQLWFEARSISTFSQKNSIKPKEKTKISNFWQLLSKSLQYRYVNYFVRYPP